MYHQTKGVNIPDILRAQEIRTSPRFELTGKTQQELESELAPRPGNRGVALYRFDIRKPDDAIAQILIWEKGERPVVWLTLEEQPIGCIWRNQKQTFQEAETLFNGFFRIRIDASKLEIFPWREYEQRARVSKQWRRILAEAAGSEGTSKWYFSLAPIPSSTWTAIERWDANQWVAWKPEVNMADIS